MSTLPVAPFVVVYTTASNTVLIKTAYGTRGLRTLLEEVLDPNNIQMADGGLVANDGGTVQIFGVPYNRFRWIHELLASDVQ